MSTRLPRLWSRLSLYLPVLLMGLFALGTWWLVRSAPTMLAPAGPAALRHEPDYYMRGFSFKSFDAAGQLQREVLGTQAQHFPDTATLEIEQARIRAYDAQGQLTVATARRALAADDGSEVQLLGGASVVREAAAGPAGGPATLRQEFRGEYLRLDRATERLSSHLPVELTRGEDRFSAQSLDYDHRAGVLTLRGKVQGVLMPRGGRR